MDPVTAEIEALGRAREPVQRAPEPVQRVARAVASGVRAVADRWRRSLQFRVLVTTSLLCILVIGLLGTYLFRSVGDGLVADRRASAEAESRSLTATAQATFDSAVLATPDDIYNTAGSLVERTLAPSSPEVARYVVITKALSNTQPTLLGTIRSTGLSPGVVTRSLQQAVSQDPTHQHTQVRDIEDPRTDGTVPAVIVGSQITISRDAGDYDVYLVFPMDREVTMLSHIANSFALGGLSLVVLVALVAWLVTRQVVAPVRRAATVAERLSSGHLSERMPARGADEIALLGTSFNAMADSLQTQIHQLESLSRVQQRFVSDVSHELRTPLTTIRMAADMIHDGRQDMGPMLGRSAELLHEELDRFEALLTDLLEISRFDAGAADLEADPVDLTALAQRVADGVRAVAARSGSKVVVRSPRETVTAEVDARRVERILRNLVVNAVEHGEGKPVTIRVATNDTAVAVVVEDHGVGLKPGEASLVFTRFWRADPARTRTLGGTGLGLAISLEDARLHNGWLQAWGEPGHGSRFRLTLPRRAGESITSSPLPLARPQGQS